MANCWASGPGSIMQKLSARRNSSSATHFFCSTSSRCMMAICPAGPPKLMNPSFSQNRRASLNGTDAVRNVHLNCRIGPLSSMLHLRCASFFAEFVQGGLEACRKLLSRAFAPVVEEDDQRPRADHMVMNGDHVQTVGAERLHYRRYLILQHRHVAGDCRALVAADDRRPGIEAHAGVDRRPHLAHRNIVTAYRDLMDRTDLFQRAADDARQLCRIQLAFQRCGFLACRGTGTRLEFTDQLQGRLDATGQISRPAVAVHVKVEDARFFPEEVVVERSGLYAVV